MASREAQEARVRMCAHPCVCICVCTPMRARKCARVCARPCVHVHMCVVGAGEAELGGRAAEGCKPPWRRASSHSLHRPAGLSARPLPSSWTAREAMSAVSMVFQRKALGRAPWALEPQGRHVPCVSAAVTWASPRASPRQLASHPGNPGSVSEINWCF